MPSTMACLVCAYCYEAAACVSASGSASIADPDAETHAAVECTAVQCIALYCYLQRSCTTTVGSCTGYYYDIRSMYQLVVNYELVHAV